METTENPIAFPAAQEPTGVEYPRWRQVWNRIASEVWYWRLRRWIPKLVWLGDEVDVTITITTIGLGFGHDKMDTLWEVEDGLRRLGLSFDTGAGCGGRDWEWDWSLRGPARVKFRGRAKYPERRVPQVETPKLQAPTDG